jgi:hypothetical protein
MRVTFYRNIKTRSGKCNNGKEVFCSHKNDTICISKIFTYPRLNDNHRLQRQKVAAAAILWKEIHPDFIKDLQIYSNAFNSQLLKKKKLTISPFNVFMKALLKHNKPFTSIDGLGGVKDILGEGINDWILDNWLPSVNNANFSNADILDGN